MQAALTFEKAVLEVSNGGLQISEIVIYSDLTTNFQVFGPFFVTYSYEVFLFHDSGVSRIRSLIAF